MIASKSVRIFFLVVVELARKYTRSLVLGFFVGILLSVLFWQAYPLVRTSLFSSTERIGLVGEFSPSTLPPLIQNQISVGLTKLSEDGTPMPALATSWEATNSGKTFIFTLGTDWKWHTGKEVAAHDVNYNIRGVTLIPTGDHTLIAYLQYPYSPFPSLVAKPIFLPGLNGLGEYKISRIQLSGGNVRSIQLYPSKDTKKKAKLYTFYQTEALAKLAFKLGEIDELADISSPSGIANWGNMHVDERVNYDRIVTLFFNMRSQVLSDKAARQALAYGIPDLPWESADSPISKTSWAYAKNTRNYTYNPAEVTRLLKTSSLASSSGELVLSTFPAYLDVAQQIAASWTNLKIPTKVQVVSSVPQDFEVLLSAQDVPPDPDQYPFWHSTQTQTNVTGYVNVKIDKLLEDGRQELDQEKRKLIYTDFQRRLVEEAPAVFLYYPTLYTVSRGK
ncbi:ABC transporter substrate-binding protein [Patescibacteria group bacterium]|nr:ABC transporter substrate-binding protein [Patescibacteria group bacterium]